MFGVSVKCPHCKGMNELGEMYTDGTFVECIHCTNSFSINDCKEIENDIDYQDENEDDMESDDFLDDGEEEEFKNEFFRIKNYIKDENY